VRRERSWEDELRPGVEILVRYETERVVVRFAVLLRVLVDDVWRPVELFDCSHGDRNDRHRYTQGGVKLPAHVFHHGTPGEAMNTAVVLTRRNHERMIEAWQR
jgi:hypothetical protein